MAETLAEEVRRMKRTLKWSGYKHVSITNWISNIGFFLHRVVICRFFLLLFLFVSLADLSDIHHNILRISWLYTRLSTVFRVSLRFLLRLRTRSIVSPNLYLSPNHLDLVSFVLLPYTFSLTYHADTFYPGGFEHPAAPSTPRMILFFLF